MSRQFVEWAQYYVTLNMPLEQYFVSTATRGWLEAHQVFPTYNYGLVVLSAMIAVLTTLSTMYLFARLRKADTRLIRFVWSIAIAAAMGGGIWSMNFIAHLSMLPTGIALLNGWLVLLSIAAMGGAAALTCLLAKEPSDGETFLTGPTLFLALGICAMFVANMAALHPQYQVRFEPLEFGLFAAYTLVASLLLVRSLCSVTRSEGRLSYLLRLSTGILSGFAIFGTHHVGMLGTVLLEPGDAAASALGIEVDVLAPIVTVVAVLLNGAAVTAAFLEQRLVATSDDAAQRIRLIMDSAPVGIAYLTPELRFEYVNRAFEEIYESEPGALDGGHLHDVLSEEHLEVITPNVRRALRGEKVTFRPPGRLGHGRAPERNVSLVPDFDSAGMLAGLFLVIQDMTAQERAQAKLRESEQRLQSLLEHIPAGVFLKDNQARYLLVNRQFEEWFGLKNEEAEGKTAFDLYPPERAVRYWAGDREILRSSVVHSDEIDIPTASGEVRTFTLIKYPIHFGGVRSGYGGIMIDVTERAEAERALRASERQAELANRAKSEFLANMSHELRTPLNAILGFAEIIETQLLGSVGNKRYVEYANDIHSSADHLLGLINDILDLSKVESGNDELMEARVSIAEVVDAVVTLVKVKARDGSIQLCEQIEADIPPLYADERKLKQILVNLVTNALKFTPPGGRVTVRARFAPEDGFILEIEDNGIGMANEDIPKAFVPFGQVESTLSRKFEGTGLGLPLTKQLVELHGGTLELQSRPQFGTTVTVRLPAERAVPSADGVRRSA